MSKQHTRVVAIVQARMPSTRLPDKVLAVIAGRPMLWHVVQRLSQASSIDRTVVATSTAPEDDAIADFCQPETVGCFRGDLDDVLDRYYQAASTHRADVVVRVTADCPLIDPRVVNMGVDQFDSGAFDYVSNVISPSYPDGLDVEVFSFSALERTWREARWRSHREHVTTYMKEPTAGFRARNFSHSEDLSELRWTVDEPDDLEFVRQVFAYLDPLDFSMAGVLDVLDRHPELVSINADIGRNEGLARSLREDGRIDMSEEES